MKPYSSLRQRYEHYPFEMDMIIPYGAKFRVENLMKINLYVTMVALSEIDFTPSDDFDLNLDQETPPKAKATGIPQSPSTYEQDTLTSPLRSKKAMADEIKGKHQQVMYSKPTITDDSWTDQHNQDFPYLFADGSELQDSSGVDSSTGSEYWSGDGKEDWTVDFGGPLTYKPTVEKPPPKSFIPDELYGEEVRIKQTNCEKNAQTGESSSKAPQKGGKRKGEGRKTREESSGFNGKDRTSSHDPGERAVEEGTRGEEAKKVNILVADIERVVFNICMYSVTTLYNFCLNYN